MIAWKAAIPAAVLGVAGAWLGTYLSSLIDGYWLSKLFGGLLLIMGVMQLFYKKEKGGDSAGSKKRISLPALTDKENKFLSCFRYAIIL